MLRTRQLSALGAGLLLAVTTAVPAQAGGTTFLGPLTHVRHLASTVPPNGDVNPYGTVVVPATTGRLHKGWVMISNFNAKTNAQGTGTTLVQVSPSGSRVQVFAKIDATKLPGACPGGVGLTTALAVLRSGWVVVGSLPTKDGSAATAKAGCLLVLGPDGKVRETITNKRINGPWDMTAVDRGRTADLFVTNVLNRTVPANGRLVNRGTVVRITLRIPSTSHMVPRAMAPVVVGSGFGEHSDPAALVVGPTGVAYDRRTGTLFVADTADNRISAIHRAATRMTTADTGTDVTANGHLNGPLGLILAPNGHLVSVNAGNGLAVESTRSGHQVVTRRLDRSGSPAGAGALFGLAVAPHHHLYFVDDATNMLDLVH
jgi:hypothetical protein